MQNKERYIEEDGTVRLRPDCGDRVCREYSAGRGCVDISMETGIPVQTLVREIKARTGRNNVRF